MSFVPRVALRNLLRNKRRTLITASAVTLGLVLLMLSSSLTDGMTNDIVENGVGAMAGHVVVQAPRWQEEREVTLTVPDTPAIAARLGAALPEATIVQRVFLEGLLTSPTGAMGVGLTAVQPDVELLVNDVGERIVEGTWLDDDPQGIVLGRTLAESLDVGLGDKVVLMAQGTGDIESRLFRVQGIFSYGVDDIDGFLALAPLQPVQQMLGLGDDVTQVSAHMPSSRDTRRATRAARAELAGAPVAVLSWPEALPELADYVRKEQTDLIVVYPVLWFIVALGIVNTVLMSVLERTHEFGVMMSVGASPRKLAALVLTESLFLGAFASAAGVSLGLLAIWPMAKNGVDLAALVGNLETAGVARDMVIYADPDPLKITLFGLGATLLTVLASLYPAYKVTTLKPVDALRAL